MTIEQQQHDENEKRPPQDPVEKTVFAGESRRRFTKSGLAASGVILTLSSRSVLGAPTINASPSASLSANQSTHSQSQVLSTGLSPAQWIQQPKWPVDKSSSFGGVFGCGSASVFKDNTLKALMQKQQDCDPYKVGMYLSAAYLNALDGRTPFLNVSRVKDMFNEWTLSGCGHFSPTAGVNWDSSQIVAYLKGTQG
ncbi:hypothetical protein [Undibacterium sp.]|jgi:hypothetical protein|uniref:hypothetical protein n=1 Tax=Undibacterium sp. TaxID=1914977 RepID=UPI002B9C9C3B|nr:hypothetical protein [Undibacterium sp.]HTD04494.1 hypothetical protein [Undibacterium sp.]